MRRAKIAAVLCALALVLTAQQLGLFHVFSDPPRVKAALVSLGPWGYAAFLAAYTLLQPFGLPGTVFIVAAPLIWPWPTAYLLSMTGTMSASVVGFSFARFVARDWISKFVPARFHAYDKALATKGFATVVTLRFIFWMPPMLHVFFGVSKVPFWTHFFGSMLGYMIPLFLTSYFGPQVFDVLRNLPIWGWAGMVAAWAAVLVGVWAFRRARRRKAAVLQD